MSLPVIRQAERIDLPQAAQLACRLWPEHNISEMLEEMTDAFDRQAVFLAFLQQQAVGFAQVSLRRDYVEGTSTSPVGYLESIFVLPGHHCPAAAGRL
jgi:aminoglycoside 6'-N-acetyltransferase I